MYNVCSLCDGNASQVLHKRERLADVHEQGEVDLFVALGGDRDGISQLGALLAQSLWDKKDQKLINPVIGKKLKKLHLRPEFKFTNIFKHRLLTFNHIIATTQL